MLCLQPRRRQDLAPRINPLCPIAPHRDALHKGWLQEQEPGFNSNLIPINTNLALSLTKYFSLRAVFTARWGEGGVRCQQGCQQLCLAWGHTEKNPLFSPNLPFLLQICPFLVLLGFLPPPPLVLLGKGWLQQRQGVMSVSPPPPSHRGTRDRREATGGGEGFGEFVEVQGTAAACTPACIYLGLALLSACLLRLSSLHPACTPGLCLPCLQLFLPAPCLHPHLHPACSLPAPLPPASLPASHPPAPVPSARLLLLSCLQPLPASPLRAPCLHPALSSPSSQAVGQSRGAETHFPPAAPRRQRRMWPTHPCQPP